MSESKQLVAIKTKDGLWLSAQPDGTIETREEVQGWERFEVVDSTVNELQLKSAHGSLYLIGLSFLDGLEVFPLPFVLTPVEPEPSAVIRGDFLGSYSNPRREPIIYFGGGQMSCDFTERLRQFDRDQARGANSILMMAQWKHREPYPWTCNNHFNFRDGQTEMDGLARAVNAAVGRNLDVWLVLWDRGLQEYDRTKRAEIVADAQAIYAAMGTRLAGILPFFEIDEIRNPPPDEVFDHGDQRNLYRDLRRVCGDLPLAIHWNTPYLYRDVHRTRMNNLLGDGLTHVFAQHPRGQTPEQIADETRLWVDHIPAEIVYVYAEACAGNNHSQDSPERRDACAQAAGDVLKSKGRLPHSFNGVAVQ